MAFVFYDTETTGTETAFDQILQFGAIKTDDELNELERFEVRCRLLPHVVPAPGALRVTKVSPATLTDPNLPTHYEAIRQIRAKLTEWSPAIFVGFNSIAFDENLLRQALFQTLHPAYLTNTDGNTRADVLRMAHATSVYAPNSISIPLGDRNQQVFRLDQLAPANGFSHEKAHEAMADVEATIHIARLIKERAKEVWGSMLRASSKSDAIQFATECDMFVLTEFYFGRPYSWLVTYCGENPNYSAQLGAFDLWHDPSDYLGLTVEQLIGVLDRSPKVIRSLRTNAQPIMMEAEYGLEHTKSTTLDRGELARRVGIIQANADFRDRVGRALDGRFADREPSPYMEGRIYDGFPSPADQAHMEEFHNVDWAQRPAIAESISDPRVKEFAERLVFVERPSVLSESKRSDLERWAASRVLSDDHNVPWMTIPKALREVDDLLPNADGDEAQLLGEVKSFLQEMADRHSPS